MKFVNYLFSRKATIFINMHNIDNTNITDDVRSHIIRNKAEGFIKALEHNLAIDIKPNEYELLYDAAFEFEEGEYTVAWHYNKLIDLLSQLDSLEEKIGYMLSSDVFDQYFGEKSDFAKCVNTIEFVREQILRHYQIFIEDGRDCTARELYDNLMQHAGICNSIYIPAMGELEIEISKLLKKFTPKDNQEKVVV